MTLNSAVLAPIPRAKVTMATMAKPGLRVSIRAANFTSFHNELTSGSLPLAQQTVRTRGAVGSGPWAT